MTPLLLLALAATPPDRPALEHAVRDRFEAVGRSAPVFDPELSLAASELAKRALAAGVEDAAFFRSKDGGQSWHEMAGLRDIHGSEWTPGAGGLGLHTIVIDPNNPNRIYIAISSAGAFRTDDGGESWKPINKGLKSQYIPDPDAPIGHCVHQLARKSTNCSDVRRLPSPVRLYLPFSKNSLEATSRPSRMSSPAL